MDAQQLLRDPQIEPTDEAIAQALGAAHDAYVRFVEGLQQRDIQVDWRYYNDGKAWLGKGLYAWTTARGARKEVTAFWLSIWEGFFRVSIFIPEKTRAEALQLSLNGETTQRIADAQQMGKLKFFPLVFDMRSGEGLEDIYTLADFRKAIR